MLSTLRPAVVADTFRSMAKWQWFRKLRKSNLTWDAPALPVAMGLLGGLFAALAVSELEETTRGMAAFVHEDSRAALWAFLFGFVAVGLPVLTIQKAALRVLGELRAHINIRPLAGEHLLGPDGWATDAVFAENVARLLADAPAQVVEAGSGLSTVLIAQRLAEQGGHVTSVDHLEEFADRTRRWLEERGLNEVATVVHAPLAEHELDGEPHPWYAMDVLDGRLPDRIDLLVVDGPPGALGRRARWPAVPLLRDRLAPDAAILLDDGDRPDETRTAHAWHALLGGSIRYLPGGKGGWLLRAGG